MAGPVEATVMGNIALQLMALGEIKDIKEARKIIANSENVTVYMSLKKMKIGTKYIKMLRRVYYVKKYSKILSPELLKVLCEMGHSDRIVIADGNFRVYG